MTLKKLNEHTIVVDDIENISLICEVLSNKTRLRIIEMVKSGIKDLDTLALELNLSKGNLSTQIKKLERAGIITSKYVPGEKGVKKIIFLNIKEIKIKLD